MNSSSAWALSAVLFAVSLTGNHDPVSHSMVYYDPHPKNHLLCQAWVLEFNIQNVLDCSDLPTLEEDADKRIELRSVLNSSYLMETTRNLCRSQDTTGRIPT